MFGIVTNKNMCSYTKLIQIAKYFNIVRFDICILLNKKLSSNFISFEIKWLSIQLKSLFAKTPYLWREIYIAQGMHRTCSLLQLISSKIQTNSAAKKWSNKRAENFNPGQWFFTHNSSCIGVLHIGMSGYSIYLGCVCMCFACHINILWQVSHPLAYSKCSILSGDAAADVAVAVAAAADFRELHWRRVIMFR